MTGGRLRLLPGLVVALTLACPSAEADEPGLEIYFIDVQGGAATLVVTPEKESILLDTGWPGFDDRDPKRIVHVLKDVAGLQQIDHLVTTHWHIDHFGGVEGLARLVPIARYYDRGLPEDGLEGLAFPDGPTADDALGIAYRKASAGKRTVLRSGDRLPLQSVQTYVVAASTVVAACSCATDNKAVCDDGIEPMPEDKSDNAHSIVVHFTWKGFDFFDGADVTWNIENDMVCPENLIGPIDLYQVTHHGMDISNHPTLLKSVTPTVAVMNNGPRKGGSPETFKRLRALPSLEALYALHRNQETGPDDNADPDLIANPDPAGGQYIAVKVAADGKSYTVRIGAEGTPREFQTR